VQGSKVQDPTSALCFTKSIGTGTSLKGQSHEKFCEKNFARKIFEGMGPLPRPKLRVATGF
jgi:hypothetical protein